MNDKQREIRSFVRRPGRMTSAQRQALERLSDTYLLNYTDQPVTPDDLFGRAAPLLLEIGFGNGDSLVELAAAQRDWNVLGIEVHEPGVGHCLLVAEKAELAHFRVIMHDAIDVLREQIPAHCVDRINVYFPDPWPKKRHHKRRLLAPKFLDLAVRVLKPNGHLHIATDWANYAEHIDELMASDARFILGTRVQHDGSEPLMRPQTKFERRGMRLGHEIVDWRFRIGD
ncbi:MAG: tRNA (guanosine(46)-N7)-methyltransferase TrmB [Pseudomonadota bacterium]